MVFRTSTFRNAMVAWAAAATLLAATAGSPATVDAKTNDIQPGKPAFVPGGTVGHAVQKVNHRRDRARQESRPHRQPPRVTARPKPAQALPPTWVLRNEAQPRRSARHVIPPPHAGSGQHRGGRHAAPPPRGGSDHRGDRARNKHRRDEHAHGRDHRRHGDRRHGYRPPPHNHGKHYRPYPRHRHGKHYRRYPRRHYGHRHRHGYPRYWWRHYYNSYLAPYPIYIVPYRVVRTVPAPAYHRPGLGSSAYCDDGAAGAYYAGGSNQTGGTIIGGIVGAAVGSQFGKGDGKLAAVGVGTLIGALIGADIGRSMDAVDRAYAAGAMNRALETAPTCTTITWENPDTGHYGSVTPTETFETSPGRYCREFQQQVVIGGKLQDAYGTACRQPDGSWEIVAEQP